MHRLYAEFAGRTMDARWTAGADDARGALAGIGVCVADRGAADPHALDPGTCVAGDGRYGF